MNDTTNLLNKNKIRNEKEKKLKARQKHVNDQ